jgi:hypothetical protein
MMIQVNHCMTPNPLNETQTDFIMETNSIMLDDLSKGNTGDEILQILDNIASGVSGSFSPMNREYMVPLDFDTEKRNH